MNQYQVTAAPLLMMSGFDKQHLRDIHPSQYQLDKPVSPSKLFDVIHSMLNPQLSTLLHKESTKSLAKLSDYSLLLVDDNPINQQVAISYLEEYGICIDTADDGEEAIEKVSRHQYDLVLMDLQMPKLDGLSATRQIRARIDAEIPIIALTAHVGDATASECLEAGMNAHLSKPLETGLLHKTLMYYLGEEGEQGDDLQADNTGTDKPKYSEIEQLICLDGLDVKGALKRINQREKLYLSLVQSFYQRYCDSSLLYSISTVSPPELQDEVHSLKSNAAYIGAIHLSMLCTDWEQGVKEGNPELVAEALSHALRDLVEQLDDLFKRLFNQLEQSDFAAEQTLTLIRSVIGNEYKLINQLDAIEQHLCEIEFEKASIIAKQLFNHSKGE